MSNPDQKDVSPLLYGEILQIAPHIRPISALDELNRRFNTVCKFAVRTRGSIRT